MSFRNVVVFLGLLCILTTACHSTEVSSPNASPSNQSAPNQPVYKPGPQPTEAELRDAINRNYEGAVTIDSTRSISFLTGDFNGDNSEDVAVIVKPGKGKLPDLNSEYVNWILDDPQLRMPKDQKKRPTRPSISGNDTLLAVIHGYEREGWRNASARQTYLLKNAVGDDFERQPARQLSAAGRSIPGLRGDVIREKLNGTAGMIFWTGARYAWHPVG
jgi:hypothetical protein